MQLQMFNYINKMPFGHMIGRFNYLFYLCGSDNMIGKIESLNNVKIVDFKFNYEIYRLDNQRTSNPSFGKMPPCNRLSER